MFNVFGERCQRDVASGSGSLWSGRVQSLAGCCAVDSSLAAAVMGERRLRLKIDVGT